MTAFSLLSAIAADPQPCLTARQIIERRLGRPLGPLETMPADERDALKRLAIQLTKVRAPKVGRLS
jgi:hypothetical protein